MEAVPQSESTEIVEDENPQEINMRLASCLVIATLFLRTVVFAANEPFEIPLWPGVAPGSESSTLEETVKDPPITDGTDVKRDRHVSGVTRPTMFVYLPDASKATGAAVVILPGGGFHILAIDKEGHDVARWLTEQGVAGIVVKYRLPDVEAGVFVHNGSLPDVQRAIRRTRSNAEKWRIDGPRCYWPERDAWEMSIWTPNAYRLALEGPNPDLG